MKPEAILREIRDMGVIENLRGLVKQLVASSMALPDDSVSLAYTAHENSGLPVLTVFAVLGVNANELLQAVKYLRFIRADGGPEDVFKDLPSVALADLQASLAAEAQVELGETPVCDCPECRAARGET